MSGVTSPTTTAEGRSPETVQCRRSQQTAYQRPRLEPGGTTMRNDFLVACGEMTFFSFLFFFLSAQEESEHFGETVEED